MGRFQIRAAVNGRRDGRRVMGRNLRIRRLASLGGMAVVAACVALGVIGCGEGSSSSTGPTGAEAAKTVSNTTPSSTDASKGSAGSEKTAGASKAQQAAAPVAEMKLMVPDGLTTANTCKGKNRSPALSWRNVPPGTAELAIFAVNVKPVKGTLTLTGRWRESTQPLWSETGRSSRRRDPRPHQFGQEGVLPLPERIDAGKLHIFGLRDLQEPLAQAGLQPARPAHPGIRYRNEGRACQRFLPQVTPGVGS